jgi:hypothetical protein
MSREPFLLWPDNRAVLDGKKRLPVTYRPWAAWGWLLLAVVAVAGGGVLLAVAVREQRLNERLHKHGISAYATVLEAVGEDEPIYVTYQYTAKNGQTYQQQVSASESLARGWMKGRRVSILYDPADPSVSNLDDPHWNPRDDQPLVVVTGGFVFLGLLLLAGWVIRFALPRRRLSRVGRLLPGEIKACSKRVADAFYLVVDYHFTGPDGTTLEGRCEAQREDLRRSVFPAPGTPVVVFYADERTHSVL